MQRDVAVDRVGEANEPDAVGEGVGGELRDQRDADACGDPCELGREVHRVRDGPGSVAGEAAGPLDHLAAGHSHRGCDPATVTQAGEVHDGRVRVAVGDGQPHGLLGDVLHLDAVGPEVSLGADDIVIRTDAAILTIGANTCQYNDSVAVTVTLKEPIGNRALIDAACLEGEAVRSGECANGGSRWTP